jgi:hypothetical protein
MENFDLWAVSSERFYTKICPGCYCGGLEGDTCEICGADLSEIEPEYDEILAQEFFDDLEKRCQEENENLKFFEISVKSGYYDGLQLYVDLTQAANNAGFTDHGPGLIENDDAHYYFDMCRSKCIRAYEAEKRRVNKILAKIGAAYGMDKLGIFARFSNGETWYTKIS